MSVNNLLYNKCINFISISIIIILNRNSFNSETFDVPLVLARGKAGRLEKRVKASETGLQPDRSDFSHIDECGAIFMGS
jgi:hypothetical protein